MFPLTRVAKYITYRSTLTHHLYKFRASSCTAHLSFSTLKTTTRSKKSLGNSATNFIIIGKMTG